MDSGTRSTRLRRPAHGGDGVAVVALAVGLTPRVAAAAPSDSQIAAAQAAAEAPSRPGSASSPASWPPPRPRSTPRTPRRRIALDEYQATAGGLRGRAAAGRRRGRRRRQATADARRGPRARSSPSPAAATCRAAPTPVPPRCSPPADPAELIERAALLEAAGAHRSDVLDRVTVLQEQATAADVVARDRRRRGRPAQGAGAAGQLEVAQAAEISARAAGVGARRPAGASSRPSWRRRSSELRRARSVPRRPRAARTARRRPGAARAARAGPPPSAATRTRAGSRLRSSAAQTAIDAAMGYLGLPYAWGGGGTRGPGPGLDPDRGRHRLRLQRPDPVRLRPGRDLDPAQQPGPVRRAAQGRPATTCSRRPRLLGDRPGRPATASTTSRSTSATARSSRRRRAATS